MSEPNHLPRRYEEAEVAKILKRATELQREEPVRARGSEGITLAELEEIAGEVGIDARLLRRAAVELDAGAGEPTGWTRLLGEQVTLLQETTVPGEIPDSEFERLIPVIQEMAQDFGQPSLLGRTLTWRAESASKSRSLQVLVSSRDGRTHLRVEERLHQMASGLFAGSMAGFGGGVGLGVGIPIGVEVLGSVLFATAFPLGILGLSYIAAREVYKAFAKKRRRVLGELLRRLADEVTEIVAEASLEDPGETRSLPPG